ncbi:acyltransferase family protein [Nocardioides lianchengensis]|uniref:Peptidoglycan/LPS O-acetylase OafA/YrhL, contains acyltransferase and SGNH-hydrolase domains n=1 Tax=Nocardioides lianchengensis TaxID=1045774 RepID=A0A1G6LU56_9ACTN|nr:acyltransferase [Nocardioides lianchengensis]NYG12444.1 peptidoglycan/LPS O-acetylase OafA/YrhL [Nocardioides lianchengensis]SDC46731.1 Peptidoglycan/LPS O-acetylase OafA/YrhL, contains acyltransferase and SGNH-hydrolase domains [Nocardioides lianchengensis]
MSLTSHRLRGLTVLRGLAIGLVLLGHAFPRFHGGGLVGVVVFFTLSGYLITGILVREIEKSGRVSFRRFYRNRVLRLAPALLLVLAVFAVGETVTERLGDGGRVPGTLLLALTYTADLPIGPPISIGMSHLWTLAVEEQFYLVWPTMLVLAVRFERLRALVWLTAVAALLACAASIFLVSPETFKVYTLPTSWGVTMIAGAAAYIYRDQLGRVTTGRRGQVLATTAVVVLVGFSLVQDAKDHWWTYLVGGPLIAALTIILIFRVSLWSGDLSRPMRAFELLGLISYAAYLWNYLIVSWIRGDELRNLTTTEGLAATLLTIAAATLSWHFVEAPALRLKDRLQARDAGRSSVPAAR